MAKKTETLKTKLRDENEFMESMLRALDDVKHGRVKEWKPKKQSKN